MSIQHQLLLNAIDSAIKAMEANSPPKIEEFNNRLTKNLPRFVEDYRTVTLGAGVGTGREAAVCKLAKAGDIVLCDHGALGYFKSNLASAHCLPINVLDFSTTGTLRQGARLTIPIDQLHEDLLKFENVGNTIWIAYFSEMPEHALEQLLNILLVSPHQKVIHLV